MQIKSDFRFDSTNLKKLIKEANVSHRDLNACGVHIANYLYGHHTPSLEILLKIADVFAVPLDYLVGRCTKEECEAIEKSFADNFRILRKENYEALIGINNGHGHLKYVTSGYEAPYPYNLIDAIFWDRDPVDHILSDDEIKGLENAISSLAEKEQEVIKYRFKDGKSLLEVADIYGRSSERIRQIEAKAIRKLRHPSRSKQILYGDEGYRKMRELRDKECELDYREKELERREELFMAKLHAIEEEKQIEWEKELCAAEEESELFSMPIEELDVSVRAFNCLKRANKNSLIDVLECIRDGSIIKLRNMGTKTAEEVIEQIKKKTGLTWEEIIGEKAITQEAS